MVVVPFYADVPLLRTALDSLLAQTDADWVGVVIDDSPLDAGLAIEVAQLVDGVADVRLTRLRNERNLGVAPTFNRAFDVAAERAVDIVTIFHADDVLEPDYVATLRAAHAQFPDAACVAPNATVIDAAGRPVRPLPDRVKQWLWPRRRTELTGERGLALLLRGQFLYCPAVSYRMTAVRAQVVPRWNERWGQVMDLELYARTVLAGGSIALERRPVYRYRRHADTTTERNSAGLVRTEEETALCKALAAEATRKGWYRAARAGRRRITVRAQALVRLPALLRARRWADARRLARLALAP
jgi:glycosyltransferase involved in cell wall biosynthesis